MKTRRLFHIILITTMISMLPMPGWIPAVLHAADAISPANIEIQKGDLVSANITARTENGELIYTTDQAGSIRGRYKKGKGIRRA